MTQPQDPGFLADVRSAAAVWRGNPTVPLIYAVIGAVYAVRVLLSPVPPGDCATKVLGQCPLAPADQGLSAFLAFASLPFSLFYVGLVGTARVWYVRRFDGGGLDLRDVWSMSWRFFGRFLLLGLLIGAAGAPVAIVGFVLLIDGNLAGALLVFAVASVVVDVVFTFVTPGLALYNPSVGAALKGGLRLLRTTWPACAAYALIPPLGITLISQALTVTRLSQPNSPFLAVAEFVGPPLTLLFAGATVAFLTRRYPPMSINGSLGYLAPRYVPDLRPRA